MCRAYCLDLAGIIYYSMIAPAQSHGFAQSMKIISQNDKRDAILLYIYGQRFTPQVSKIASRQPHQLRQQKNHLSSLTAQNQLISNQLHALACNPRADKTLEQSLQTIQQIFQIQIESFKAELCKVKKALPNRTCNPSSYFFEPHCKRVSIRFFLFAQRHYPDSLPKPKLHNLNARIMLTDICPKLPMRNKVLTKDFYVNRLNFELLGDYAEYLIVGKDRIEIHFFEFKDLDPKQNYGQVYIRTDDIDGLYQALLDNKTSIHPNGGLQTKPWGQKEFALLDPDNNLLTFGQGLK